MVRKGVAGAESGATRSCPTTGDPRHFADGRRVYELRPELRKSDRWFSACPIGRCRGREPASPRRNPIRTRGDNAGRSPCASPLLLGPAIRRAVANESLPILVMDDSCRPISPCCNPSCPWPLELRAWPMALLPRKRQVGSVPPGWSPADSTSRRSSHGGLSHTTTLRFLADPFYSGRGWPSDGTMASARCRATRQCRHCQSRRPRFYPGTPEEGRRSSFPKSAAGRHRGSTSSTKTGSRIAAKSS